MTNQEKKRKKITKLISGVKQGITQETLKRVKL